MQFWERFGFSVFRRSAGYRLPIAVLRLDRRNDVFSSIHTVSGRYKRPALNWSRLANEEPDRRPVVNQLATSPDHDGQWLPHRGRSTGFRQRGFDDAGPSNASMGPVAGMSDTVLDQLLTLQNLGYGDTTVPPVQPQTAMDVQDTAGTRHLDTDSRQMRMCALWPKAATDDRLQPKTLRDMCKVE